MNGRRNAASKRRDYGVQTATTAATSSGAARSDDVHPGKDQRGHVERRGRQHPGQQQAKRLEPRPSGFQETASP